MSSGCVHSHNASILIIGADQRESTRSNTRSHRPHSAAAVTGQLTPTVVLPRLNSIRIPWLDAASGGAQDAGAGNDSATNSGPTHAAMTSALNCAL